MTVMAPDQGTVHPPATIAGPAVFDRNSTRQQESSNDSFRFSNLNALTIDLEDWAQGTLGHQMPITDRVLRNTDRILAILSEHNVRATFFALGKVCEKYPQLLDAIVSAGHEVASHGWGHQLVSTLSPEQFEEDVSRSVAVIKAQTGRAPIGYRAPAFSVTRQCLWVGPILSKLGFRYSSSIFPIAGRRYGIAEANRFVHRWANCELVEFPLTTMRRLDRNIPMSGGGYLRLLPANLVGRAIREMNNSGHPAVLYMHPYEMDVAEIAELTRSGWSINWRTRWHQSLFRRCFRARLEALLGTFSFAPMADVLHLQ